MHCDLSLFLTIETEKQISAMQHIFIDKKKNHVEKKNHAIFYLQTIFAFNGWRMQELSAQSLNTYKTRFQMSAHDKHTDDMI